MDFALRFNAEHIIPFIAGKVTAMLDGFDFIVSTFYSNISEAVTMVVGIASSQFSKVINA
ncbi:MAG: hypothetical protein ACRDBM_00610 [Sporomusa sp.]